MSQTQEVTRTTARKPKSAPTPIDAENKSLRTKLARLRAMLLSPTDTEMQRLLDAYAAEFEDVTDTIEVREGRIAGLAAVLKLLAEHARS